MSFPVKLAQPLELRPATVEIYQESIRKAVKAGKMVAMDPEAKAFLAAKQYTAPAE